MDNALVVDGGLVEVVERLVADHAADGFGEEPVAAEDADFVAGAFHGDGVGGDKFFEGGILDLLDSVAAEDGVGNHGTDALGTAFHNDTRGFADGGTRVDDVVEENDVFVFDVADEAHLTNLVGFVAVFVADDKTVVEGFGIHAGAFAATHVGAGEHDIFDVEFFADVGHEQRGAIEVVNGDVEEALNLVGVEIHADNAVHTRGLDHVGDELGSDGDMGLVFSVLTSEAIVGDDGDDFFSRGALGCVDHHKELEEVVGWGESGLDDEDNTAADSFLIGRLEFAVGILENGGISQGDTVNIGHAVCQVSGCTTRENEYFIRFFFAFFMLILRLQRYNIFLE